MKAMNDTDLHVLVWGFYSCRSTLQSFPSCEGKCSFKVVVEDRVKMQELLEKMRLRWTQPHQETQGNWWQSTLSPHPIMGHAGWKVPWVVASHPPFEVSSTTKCTKPKRKYMLVPSEVCKREHQGILLPSSILSPPPTPTQMALTLHMHWTKYNLTSCGGIISTIAWPELHLLHWHAMK